MMDNEHGTLAPSRYKIIIVNKTEAPTLSSKAASQGMEDQSGTDRYHFRFKELIFKSLHQIFNWTRARLTTKLQPCLIRS